MEECEVTQSSAPSLDGRQEQPALITHFGFFLFLLNAITLHILRGGNTVNMEALPHIADAPHILFLPPFLLFLPLLPTG